MDAAIATEPDVSNSLGVWIARVRFVLAVGLLWGVLRYLIEPFILGPGLDRPAVLLASEAGVGAGLVAGAVLLVGAAFATVLAGSGGRTRTLFVFAMALALWAGAGGTMDDWLARANIAPGPGSSTAYRALLGEYLYLALLVAAAAAIGARISLAADSKESVSARAFGLGGADKPINGLMATLTTAGIAAVMLVILSGPALAHTRRGQVFFSVAVSFYIAVLVARSLTHVRHPFWYWTAPLLVGVGGLLLAAMRPVLGGDYSNINLVPANGLARPLPVEMIGLGLLGTLWALRSGTAAATGERAS